MIRYTHVIVHFENGASVKLAQDDGGDWRVLADSEVWREEWRYVGLTSLEEMMWYIEEELSRQTI